MDIACGTSPPELVIPKLLKSTASRQTATSPGATGVSWQIWHQDVKIRVDGMVPILREQTSLRITRPSTAVVITLGGSVTVFISDM